MYVDLPVSCGLSNALVGSLQSGGSAPHRAEMKKDLQEALPSQPREPDCSWKFISH